MKKFAIELVQENEQGVIEYSNLEGGIDTFYTDKKEVLKAAKAAAESWYNKKDGYTTVIVGCYDVDPDDEQDWAYVGEIAEYAIK